MENRYCIIAGDLVNVGGTQKSFNDFYDQFIKKLIDYVPLEHIVCTAGNHDLNRSVLDDKKIAGKQRELTASKDSESQCNETYSKEDSVINAKFKFFDEFCKNKMQMPTYNLLGFSTNFLPEISVFCLNSAILSTGGHEKFAKDSGNLRVETTKVFKWAQNNEGRYKILVMHHPIYHLTEHAQKELNVLIRQNIDVCITGHLHNPDYANYIGVDGECCKYCSSPQLFSDKHDANGYSILHFNGSELSSIQYRQWSTFRREFVGGNNFTGTNDGIITFEKFCFTYEDSITNELTERLQESLQIYNYTPSWFDRRLSNLPFNQSSSEVEEIKYDHINIINSDKNIQIVGGTQFGLTTLVHKLILEAWKVKNEQWLYIDAQDIRLNDIERHISNFIKHRDIKNEDISTVVVDNWGKSKNDRESILKKIQSQLADSRIILINNEEDTFIFNGLKEDLSQEGFEILYLRELGRRVIRQLTKEFLSKYGLNKETDEDKILEQLILELTALNVHQTPVNCIQILMNFKHNFETRPANRSKVLSTLLQLFFLNPESFFYSSNINEKDCFKYMGALCEYLMRSGSKDERVDTMHQMRFFTEEDYMRESKKAGSGSDENKRRHLFQAMKDAKVIVPYLQYYEFRFSYWLYYFTAQQMYIKDEFYDYMIQERHCIYMPDIVEFYSGIDDKCTSMAEMLVENFEKLSKEVYAKLGANMSNPFNQLKCRQNPALENKTTEELSNAIEQSRLPNNLKDTLLEKNISNTQPFNQGVETFFEHLKVLNMLHLSRSASRALRNAEYISDELRHKLYDSIQMSWLALAKIILFLTPALAEIGQGGIGGARFRLVGEFPKDMGRKKIHIMTAIPFNIITWYKDDVYSERRLNVYKRAINLPQQDGFDALSKYLNTLLVLFMRPTGWIDIVKGYMDSQKKNSYYFGNMVEMMQYCYSIETMSETDLKQTRKLLTESIKSSKRPHKNNEPEFARFMKSHKNDNSTPDLPKRQIGDW